MSDVITYPLSAAIELCEQLDNDTPETDAAASPHIGFYSCATVTANFARRLEIERDEARAGREAYKQLAVKHAQDRDEAREALMKIEDLFIDGTDIYADREKMGMIARNALEESK